MAWSYNVAQLATSALFRVRLKIGDTIAADPQLTDEEIAIFISQADTEDGAAWLAAKTLAGRYARYVDKWVGDLKILASQKHRAYLDLVTTLGGAARVHGVPSAGGIRVSSKETIEGDTDLVVPFIKRGLHDHPGDT